MTTISEAIPRPANSVQLLADLDLPIQQAVDFAERWDEVYRPAIFQIALTRLLEESSLPPSRPQPGTSSRTTSHSGRVPSYDDQAPLPPLTRLANATGLDEDALSRAVEIQSDGHVRLLGRIGGRTVRELQKNYSVVYAYVKEKALGEQHVDVEELRSLCIAQGCYDRANFTANFRRDGLLREVGTRGSRDRKYVASRSALDNGEALLRDLVNQ